MTVKAPAKVNIHLAVKDRRSDGFHCLESIFLALDLGDTLNFQAVPCENSLEILMKSEDFILDRIPVEKNIIFNAVSMFRKTGFNNGLKITVQKRIPPGGGLGGGSSDAAAALLALDAMENGDKAIKEMAASLGSDVPFFLCGSAAAWAGGRGEIIQPIASPENLFFVLVNPGFQSDTAGAYLMLDEYRLGRQGENNNLEKDKLIKAFYNPPWDWPFYNDFLPVYADKKEGKVYSEIISELIKHGAKFSSLSGSGSTCFGVFSDRHLAEKACKAMEKNWNYVKFTFPLALCV
jgi:4-diphosphocytidyl-2-C-methyl-D-erythritol kinase